MIKTVHTAVLAVFLTTNVQANAVGLYLGGQVWQSETNGAYGEQNALNDLNLKNEQQINYFIAVEHPFRLFPNVRISTTTLDTTGNTNISQDYSDDTDTAHVDIHVDLDVDGNFNVSYIDYTLYYGVFENHFFSFDLGLTARDFGGSVTVSQTANIVTTTRDFIWDGEDHDDHDYHNIIETTNTSTTNKIKTHEIEPMLYLATKMRLPFKGFSVFAQGDLSLKNDHSLYEYQAGLSYKLIDNMMMDFNLNLGYRVLNMEFENTQNLSAELEFKGAFIGMVAHF